MAVAFGMGDADQRTEREVLLHAEAGLTREVLAGDEEFSTFRTPLRRSCGIDDGFVDALARFRGDAAIAELTRRRKLVIAIVGLVDDEVTTGKRPERRLPGNLARHRLFEIQQSVRNRRQRALPVEAVDQRGQGCDVGILFVGIERHAVVVRRRTQFLPDADKAGDIVLHVAVELELEIARPGVLICIRYAAFALDPVTEAHGVPDRDALKPSAVTEELRYVLILQVGRQAGI